MRLSQTGDVWWKSAVFYCADVETFQDSDGDGVGDLRGMTERIEYLADLGITCLWLMPLYPTAGRDDGYDITDFFGVDPRLGTLGDFVELVRTARSRGIRVVVDFVMNHTSDKHPWFQERARSVDDPYRQYYVWRADEAAEREGGGRLPRQGGQHLGARREDGRVVPPPLLQDPARPQRRQPRCAGGDRAHPRLLARARRRRLPDRRGAVPLRQRLLPRVRARRLRPAAYLKDVRDFVTRRLGDAALLGEVNLPYPQQKEFFGGADGDGLNMQFDFIGMQRLYLSLAREDATPLADALRERPALDETSQWANFVRNHDELTLDKLPMTEREEVFAAFGPDPDMQLFGRGLRRRLPTMLGGDERRIRLVYSLMFSLPGTPTLFYGEEIGMGENLDVEGRLAVRTPMQWDDGPNGGFSTAPKRRLHPPPAAGLFSPEHVNAAASGRTRTPSGPSCAPLVRRYRQMPQIGWSDVEVLDHDTPSVLAHVARCDDWRLLALHNLGAEDAEVSLRLGSVPEGSVLRDVLDGDPDVELPPSGASRCGSTGTAAVAARPRPGRAGLRLTSGCEVLGEGAGDGPRSLARVRRDRPGEAAARVVHAPERHPGVDCRRGPPPRRARRAGTRARSGSRRGRCRGRHGVGEGVARAAARRRRARARRRPRRRSSCRGRRRRCRRRGGAGRWCAAGRPRGTRGGVGRAARRSAGTPSDAIPAGRQTRSSSSSSNAARRPARDERQHDVAAVVVRGPLPGSNTWGCPSSTAR